MAVESPQILPELDNRIMELYNKPLKNNPNVTYGTAFSPDQTKVYAIGNNYALQQALVDSGEMTVEQINEINNNLPKLQERLDFYDVPPVPYDLKDKAPGVFRTQQAVDKRVEPSIEELNIRREEPRASISLTRPRFDEAQKLASYGVNPDNPFDFGDDKRRFFTDMGLGPRNRSLEQMQFLLNKYDIKGKLAYVDGKNPKLGFKIKPEGSDEFQLLRSPYVQGEDVLKGIVQEGPAIAFDIGFTLAQYGIQPAGKAKVPKSILENFKRIMGLSATASAGTVTGDWARIILGDISGSHDLTLEEQLKEAGMMGLLAFGGTAAITTVGKTFPAIYESLKGTRIPPEFYEILAKFRAKALKEEAGIPSGTSLKFGEDQLTVKQINEQVEALGKEIGKDLGEYTPTIAGASSADESIAQNAADFEYLFLKNASNNKYQDTYRKIKDGNQEVIDALLAAINSQRSGIEVGADVSAEITRAAGIRADEFVDSQTAIIDKLRDPKYFNDPEFEDALFKTTERGSETLPKIVSNLQDIKTTQLKKSQEEFNNVFSQPKYDSVRGGATFTKKEIKGFFDLRRGVKQLVNFADDPDVVKTLNQVLSNDETIYRLMGKNLKTGQKFENPQFTMSELNNMRIVFNDLRTSKIKGVARIAGEIEQALSFTVDKAIQDDVWVNKLGNAAKQKYGKKDLIQIDQYKRDNDFGLDISEAYKNMSQAYLDTNNVVLTTLLNQGNPDYLASTLLKQGGTAVNNFIDLLKTGGHDGVMQIRKAMAKHIDDNIFDSNLSTPLQQAKDYRVFVKKNKEVLKAVYGEDYKKMFINQSSFKRNILEPIQQYDNKIVQLKQVFGTDPDSVNPVFDIVNNIIRSSNSSKETGLLSTQIKFLMETVGDDALLKEQITNLTKTFIVKDVLKLRKGGSGQWEIDPNALNRLLYEGLGPEDVLGPRLTFDEVYSSLLGGGKDAKKYTDNLKLLNNILMREQGVDPSGAAKQALSEKTLAFPGARFIFRMLIPPLTQRGRRATALNNALNARAGDYLGELIADPKLLDQTVRYMDGKITTQKYASMLSAYGIVHIQDLGDELQYYDETLKINNKKKSNEATLDQINSIMNSYRGTD